MHLDSSRRIAFIKELISFKHAKHRQHRNEKLPRKNAAEAGHFRQVWRIGWWKKTYFFPRKIEENSL